MEKISDRFFKNVWYIFCPTIFPCLKLKASDILVKNYFIWYEQAGFQWNPKFYIMQKHVTTKNSP